MTFTPPPKIQPRNLEWNTAPIERGLVTFGNALANRRAYDQDREIGEAYQTGGLNALQRKAAGEGRLGLAMKAENALQTRRLREAQIAKASRAPAGPKPTAMMRHFQMAQKNPEFAKFLDSRKPGNTTNVTIGHEKSYDKEIGKQLAKDFKAYQGEGSKARAAMNDLKVMEKALDDPNVYTGVGGTTAQGVKRAAQALGIKVQGVGTGELINSISKKIAVGMKDNLPGPMSDSDRRFLVEMAPGLNYTPEGNRLMIQMAKLQRQYVIDRAAAFRDYATAQGGRPDSGVYAFIDSKVGAPYAQRFSGLIQELRSQGTAAPRSPTAGFPQIKSADDYNQLQSGQQFIDPQGNVRTKK